MNRLHSFAILIALGTLATSAQAQFSARTHFSGEATTLPPAGLTCGIVDDGSTENAIGLTAGGEIGWIQGFTCPNTSYDSIATAYGSLMFPGSVTNGSASRLAAYEDSDGVDPLSGLTKVAELTTVVTNGDTDILNKVQLVNTITRGTTNFPFATWVVGCADHLAGQFPGPLDQSTSYSASWVVGSTSGPGTLNLDTLTANNVPPTNMAATGFPGAWLLRISNTGGGTGPGTGLCFGDGSGTNCPCGNNSTSGGCSNGPPMPAGQGAVLTATGGNSISGTVANPLVLTADFTTNQPGLFFQGDVTIAGGNGVAFGDGLRCCGTNVIRLEIADPPGTNGVHTTSTTQNVITTSPPGTIAPGVKQCYQWWYRNPGRSLCGANFNLSNAISVTWAP